MADLYVCSTCSTSYPTEDDYVRHCEIAHPVGSVEVCLGCSTLLEGQQAQTGLGCSANAGLQHYPKSTAMTTDQMREQYVVKAFAAPYVVVIRKSDGVEGTLLFNSTHPRYYYSFKD